MDTIVAVTVVGEEEKLTGNIIAASANGNIKRIKAEEISHTTTKRGQKFMGIKGDDKVVSVQFTKTDDFQVVSITQYGYMLRYLSDQVPEQGLAAAGVKNMNLQDDDKVVSMIAADKSDVTSGKTQAIVFTDNGKVKRFKVKEVKDAARGSKGNLFAKQIKTNPHRVINMFNIRYVDSLSLLTTNEERKTIIPKKDVKLTTFDEGLTLIDKAGISIIVGNKVKDESMDAIPEEEMTKEQTKELQITIDSILKKI
jgi:topoisomerase-4 subunit A